MFTALRAMLRDPEGKIILVWVIAQILLGTLVYAWLEGWSPVDSLYFSVVTLATVGFGDIVPKTEVARTVTMVQMLGDIVLVGLVVQVIVGAVRTGLARQETDTATTAVEKES